MRWYLLKRLLQAIPLNVWTWRDLAETSMWSPSIVIGNVFVNCSLQVLVTKVAGG